jgi:hypothetical protein
MYTLQRKALSINGFDACGYRAAIILAFAAAARILDSSRRQMGSATTSPT